MLGRHPVRRGWRHDRLGLGYHPARFFKTYVFQDAHFSLVDAQKIADREFLRGSADLMPGGVQALRLDGSRFLIVLRLDCRYAAQVRRSTELGSQILLKPEHSILRHMTFLLSLKAFQN